VTKHLRLIVCGSCLLSGCGGGSMGGGSPNVSLSPTTLTFGVEVISTASQPLSITLSNSGTATLSIASIVASANFEETNNCGSALASGANCVINVTFMPSTTGSLNGTVSVTDNATGSPQTVSLSGTGTTVAGGSCSVQGQQCGAPQLPPCCSGLTCVPASTRAFCEPW
jgi:Abnormal spindle-like microcephaly-assoc'd, ASPM-SPD-2-Hydin